MTLLAINEWLFPLLYLAVHVPAYCAPLGNVSEKIEKENLIEWRRVQRLSKGCEPKWVRNTFIQTIN